ncbi:3-hydroxyisobutyrate dehydrogenase [Hansschlegelia zhihuaiae]|uniref:3-hydroxyisobutyrate dehydrogenase n=1 Tax=Hansschlegelia zhihuaiae TaxID=405005 RepID=A0A4Q0M9I3_9HYPH|nr:3-hydroxyisobutyrate dehydrogenase [Hansschlegelia zhihuaiae]
MIGFIGLGNMGGPMAANLAMAGHEVLGFDVTAAAVDRAAAAGVSAARSIEEAAAEADIVVTMLPSGSHLVSVYETLVAVARPDALLIDCSTVDVASCVRAHEMARANGLASIDAPVSGGVSGAAAATLTFMVGGDEAAVERARPALEAMGRRVVHCGVAGAGQAAKTCNNMVLGISMIALAEAFTLGERLNLSHQALFDVLSTSSGQCWALVNHCPVPGPVPASAANHGFRPGFAAALMLKDLRLARDAADAAGVDIPLGRQAAGLYEQFNALDEEGLDYAAIIKLVRERSGMK